MKKTILTLATLLLAQAAQAALKTQMIDYKDGDAVLSGYLAYDDSFKGPRPGVLVFHEWWGFGPYVQRRADMLAKLGYVAFAGDLYGKGKAAKNHEEAGKLSGALREDRSLMRSRAQAALAVLKAQKNVDPAKTGAIGYCFGGSAALELARSGADLKGVVSFHGPLDTPHPEQTKAVKAKILVCQGGDDQYTLGGVAGFQDEMRKAGADWQINTYSHAVHSFTVKESGDDPSSGVAYNEAADRHSWRAMQDFFGELFGR